MYCTLSVLLLLCRIKSLRKEIIAKESQTKDKMLKRLQRKQERLNGTRRVGKYKLDIITCTL